ncbi:MAG: IS66 family insertion sequence element accessory protein TnpB [Pseudobacteriovorax sp.]|nr:IS66 family insertion sequence element accessory protein TnpB [Pseudobacteriovorax sp.]
MMFFSTTKIKIYLYTKTIDGHWGIDRLAHLAQSKLGLDPRSGSLFVFFNKSKTRAKIYYFDGSGSCLFYKRLEKGQFKFPRIAEGGVSCDIAPTELSLLLEGGRLENISKPAPWNPEMRVSSH